MKLARVSVALSLLMVVSIGLAGETGLSLESEILLRRPADQPAPYFVPPDQPETTPLLAGFGQGYVIRNGFFAGVGGSYNSVRVNQRFYAAGTTNLTIDDVPVASGEAAGPAAPFSLTQTTFAPVVQFGFFRSLSDSPWQWGAKFSYKYLGLNFTDYDVVSPQDGHITPTNNAAPGDTFTGHEIQDSVQTSVNHQLSLFPLFGRSFKNSQIYFGGGPVVFETQASVYQAIGFANLNSTPTIITGRPVDFSNSLWMWGGGAQFGFIYYLSPTWFLDFSYDFVFTGNYTLNNTSGFVSQTGSLTDTGVLYITTTRHIFAQSIGVTINKLF